MLAMLRIPAIAIVLSSLLWGQGGDYLIQRGDDLEIRALDMNDLNATVRVRPDGRISLLLLDDIQAAGLTATQLGKHLADRYAGHFRNPRIAVMVKSFSSFTAYVGGEVATPGAVPLVGTPTLSAAIIQAGGLRETARASRVQIIRYSGGETPSTIEANLDEILTQGKPDFTLRPGDVVFVPKSFVNVYVAGEVASPGLLPVTGRLTVAAAIVRAGGLQKTANGKQVVLLRQGSDGKAQVSKVNVDAVLARGGDDLALQAYDVVFVPKTAIAEVDKFIDQHIRQLIPISLSAGFSYLLGGTGIFR